MKKKTRREKKTNNQDCQSLELICIGDGEWVFSDQDTSNEIYELLEEALDLMEEMKFGSAKAKLKRLLKLNPYHIDAIHHLAIIENSKKNKDSSSNLWERGVMIGRSAISKRFKRGSSRIPWLNLDNRPFLRCLHGHGFALLDEDRIDEAIDVFKELIDYNPDDNLGARDNLMSMFIETGRLDEALELSRRYDDDAGPCIMYGKALTCFLKGDMKEADKSLVEAMKYTPRVAEEILKKDHSKPDGWKPGYITLGGWDEAYYYWEMQGKYWTHEAIEWLRENIPSTKEEEFSNGK